MTAWQLITYIIGAIVVGVSTTYSARANKRSDAKVAAVQTALDEAKARTEDRRVVGEAYDRAQMINSGLMEGLRVEIARLQTELAALRTTLEAKDARAAKLETRLSTEEAETRRLRGQVDELQRTVDRMAGLLRQHNIPFTA